jgi:alpha-glucosidase (family GH31 glycosyl hydrolase)
MEYDVHALFGHMQAKLTSEILSDKNNSANPYKDQRMLISSTSTFAGTGQYAQTHITGQKRTFEHMKYSIASMMRFNMFGIPYTGADVCGTKRWVSN